MVTIIVALITGSFTSIPPLVKNKQELKLKRIEAYENTKRQAIIDFSNAVSDCICINGILSAGEIANFDKNVNKLLMYFPDVDLVLIDKIKVALYNDNTNTKQKLVRPLIIELSKSIPEI